MRVSTLLLSATLLTLPCVQAQGADTPLPELKSQTHCAALVAASGADEEAMARCLRMEETTYRKLQNTYLSYSEEARRMCEKLVVGTDTGYMGLRYCLRSSR